jgi:type I restriction enzyme, S subunit
MVPDGWRLARLGEIATVTKLAGFEYTSHFDYSIGGEITVIRGLNIRDGILSLKDVHTIPRHTSLALPRSQLKAGDIVMGYVGTIGDAAIIPEDDKYHLAPNVAKITSNHNFVDPLYLHTFIRGSYFQNELRVHTTSSSQPALSMESIRKTRVYLPPIGEQRKIAAILSTWDQAIEKQEALIATKQQRKRALMQQFLTGKKRFKEFEGREWVTRKFTDLFKSVSGKAFQIQKSQYRTTGRYPVVDQGQQAVAGYTDSNMGFNDVPIIVFGDHTRIIKWVDFPFVVGADGTQLLTTQPNLNTRFGFYLLHTVEIPNLGYSRHFKVLKESTFKYPVSKIEQEKIASVLTTADAEITSLQNQLAAYKQQKCGLMQQLLTGKKRVRVDEGVAA